MKSKTNLIYLTDAYTKTAKAKIVKVETTEKAVALILDQTIFYPQGGGQPADLGEIKGKTGNFQVTHVAYNNGEPLHQGKMTGELKKNDEVELKIDWNQRLRNMQLHTAGHILHEAVAEITPECPSVEGNHGIGKKTIVKFKGIIDQTSLPNIEDKCNEIIANNEKIITQFVSKEDILSQKIYIPFKLPENKPLRIMQIGDRPPMPDGGTQLKTTGECPPIKLTSIEYKDSHSIIHYQIKPLGISHQPSVKKPTTDNQQPTATLKGLKSQITDLQSKLKADVEAKATADLQIKYLGKKGQLNQLIKLIPRLPQKNRGEAGKLINQTKQDIQKKISNFDIRASNLQADSWLDVTIPGIPPQSGHLHLITQAIEEIESIFLSLGFVRRRYPEIEIDWYYAEGLNIPKDHPARDDQETFYLSENVVLTAHTSNGQLREMEHLKEPPIKMINIGKTYRRQASNTHSPMFHQFEGLLVDNNINMSHLVGVSNYFVKQYFGPDREIRLRPHHFQFTEPSFEVDINCHICKGTGKVKNKKCKVCKGGWLELGGAGMVHPNVLKNGGIDPQKYSGFAFGWGVERVIMMKHNVTDNLRELYTQDLRFLSQS